MSVELTPYIFFKGNCREVMEFYKNIFGGKLTVQTYADAHMDDSPMGPDAIMHAMLEGGVAKIFGSDTAKASPEAKKISLSLSGPDEDTLRKVFNGLGEGVEIEYPLAKAPWGDFFGSLTDKYGVEWMVNITVASDKPSA